MIGQRVGNWILTEELGRGPHGTVYKGRSSEEPGRFAAIKILTPDPARGTEFQAKFTAEMLAFHRLSHPNILKFYDAGVLPGGIVWYATQYFPGTDVVTFMKNRPKKLDEPGLNWHEEILAIAVQIARALKHGHHRSILHRNLKPSNVIIHPDGSVKVADFGVTKVFPQSPLTLPADPLGTAGFLAPEHFNGKPLTRRSDLYALGGVIYTLVTGRPPFNGNTTAEFLHKHCYTLPDRPAHFVRDLPTDFDELICALLAKDPNRRPANAGMVIEILDQIRGKVERKGKKVPWPPEPHDASGAQPALTEAEEKRGEADEEDSRERPLMSRPLVVIPLFVLVVGVILTLIFWPRPSAEEYYRQAEVLLKSDDPADWDRAWNDYLEPLSSRYPDKYTEEIKQARVRIKEHRTLRNAIEQAQRTRYATEGERLYNRGLGLAQAGDLIGAKRTWEEVSRAFAGVESEKQWVRLAQTGLEELSRRPPPTISASRPTLNEALERAKRLRQEGKGTESNAIFEALEVLYRDDPSALELIRKTR